MRCFHEIQGEIRLRCPVEGPAEYQRTYINPLVEQTRRTVLDKCDIAPNHQHYFISAAPPGERDRTTTAFTTVAAFQIVTHAFLYAFILARWQQHIER